MAAAPTTVAPPIPGTIWLTCIISWLLLALTLRLVAILCKKEGFAVCKITSTFFITRKTKGGEVRCSFPHQTPLTCIKTLKILVTPERVYSKMSFPELPAPGVAIAVDAMFCMSIRLAPIVKVAV